MELVLAMSDLINTEGIRIMNSASNARRSVSWFPKGCKYIPLRHLLGVEVLPAQRRATVQVSGTTLHGTPAELRDLARQICRAADFAESAS